MTLLQIAREQCSNFNPDGSCAGLDFDEHGKHFRFKAEKCVLSVRGVRCHFFEQCVVPMDRSALGPLPRKEWEECLANYRKASNVTSTKARTCPVCNERELEKGKQLCYVCRDGKRRETWRGQKGE